MQRQSTGPFPDAGTNTTAMDINQSQSACAASIIESATKPPQRERPRSTLEGMPPEILLLIVDVIFGDKGPSGYKVTEKSFCVHENCIQQSVCYSNFGRERDVIYLAATCKRLHKIISPAVFKHDIRQNFSSALILSAKRGLPNAALQALEAGADVNAPDRTGFDFDQELSVFSCDSCDSCEFDDDMEDSERLPVSSSLTALHWATFFGNEDMMRLLIGRGANTNARADVGFRSYLAPMNGVDGEEGYGIDEWEEGGLSFSHSQKAMFCHTSWEHSERQSGAQYSQYSSCLSTEYLGGANALFFALKALHDCSEVQRWRTSTVYLHVEQFAGRAPDGWRLSMAKLLIEHGSSLITRENGQVHALHQASAYGQNDIVKFLIDELGTDPNIKDNDSNTALHYVAIGAGRQLEKEGDMQIRDLWMTTQLLLDRGADPCLQNFRGLTAEKVGLPLKWLERA